MPQEIRLGIQAKEKKRKLQSLKEAKETGMMTRFTKSDILGKQAKKKKKDTGLFGSIGTIKQGVMHISQKQIDSISNTKSGKRSSFKRR